MAKLQAVAMRKARRWNALGLRESRAGEFGAPAALMAQKAQHGARSYGCGLVCLSHTAQFCYQVQQNQ